MRISWYLQSENGGPGTGGGQPTNNEYQEWYSAQGNGVVVLAVDEETTSRSGFSNLLHRHDTLLRHDTNL